MVTSLTFIVVAAHLGAQLHKIDASTEAALITAGLISVLLFPALALVLFGREEATMPTLAFEEKQKELEP